MRVVVSLSRRTEPFFYADRLANLLADRYPPERVHTVVVWTKFPQAVLERLRPALRRYDQVYVHLTITGLGGTPIEPHVPPPEHALARIPDLVDFLGDPRRLRVRPDPLLLFRRGKQTFTNVQAALSIIGEAAALGVKSFSTSFVELYPKVRRRLGLRGWEAVPFDGDQRRQIWSRLATAAAACGATLYACCIPELPTSSCIDGQVLSQLHPYGEPCRTDKARGQRDLCGCTHAVDLGWYNMVCPSGCLYCYANAGDGN
ncbi:DUF1848 family protein [Moorellaceae bacterium AZ2]